MQNFTARMELLMAASAFGLGPTEKMHARVLLSSVIYTVSVPPL